jgi:hypothetical protein
VLAVIKAIYTFIGLLFSKLISGRGQATNDLRERAKLVTGDIDGIKDNGGLAQESVVRVQNSTREIEGATARIRKSTEQAIERIDNAIGDTHKLDERISASLATLEGIRKRDNEKSTETKDTD